MDRRQQKTRKALFAAFSKLLAHKRYEHITVQDIIDEANVGRSTFYAHFETKDTLLKALCSDIFDHIFDGDFHDYPDDVGTLEGHLAHILWHLREIKADVTALLSSESGELFLQHLRDNLTVLFRMYLGEFPSAVTDDFLLNHLVGSFAETVKWWVKTDMQTSPEQTAHCFMAVTETH